MNNYKQEIQNRVRIILLTGIVIGILLLFAFAYWLINYAGTKGVSDFRTYVIIGAGVGGILGVEVVAVFRIIRYKRILKDHSALENIRTRENDERNRIIALKASESCLYLTMMFLAIAIMISVFFSQIVFFTLAIVFVVVLVLYLLLKLFFSRKM